VTESFGDPPPLTLHASDPSTVRALVNYSETQGGPYKKVEMAFTRDGFIVELPILERGHRWYYHIDAIQNNVKIAQLPPDGDQFIKFKGRVSPALLVPHILFMFATIFFGIMAVFTAIDYSRAAGEPGRAVRFLLLTLISAALGGFVFGPPVTYQTFGEGWGGWPVGSDWTDTKTEVFFLFWLLPLILSWKSLRGGTMSISPRIYSSLVIVSFTVTLITFLIPHSI
jgi:hypothetical protein